MNCKEFKYIVEAAYDTRTAIYISGKSDISIGKLNIFWQNPSQNVLTYEHHLSYLQRLEKIKLAKMELTLEHFRAIINAIICKHRGYENFQPLSSNQFLFKIRQFLLIANR